MPELYLLLIFASIFEPGLLILLTIMTVFGWMGLADYVRAEGGRAQQTRWVAGVRFWF